MRIAVGVSCLVLVAAGVWVYCVPNPSGRILRESLKGVDRIDVETKRLEGGTNVVQERDPKRIQEVIDSLQFDEWANKTDCLCSGACDIKFCAGTRCVATVARRHADRLRWYGGNDDCEMVMRPAGVERLDRWLREVQERSQKK